MRRDLVAFLVLASILVSTPVLPGERPIVAVFDIEAKRIELGRDLLDILAERLAAALTASGRFQVVPRDQIRQRLFEEKNKSYKECYDQSCQIELGRELAAEKSVATKIGKIGNICTVTATMFDLKKAATEAAASYDGKCNEEGLLDSVKEVARKIVGGSSIVTSTPKLEKVPVSEEVNNHTKTKDTEVRQPGTRLIWLRCPIGQKWNGKTCVRDCESFKWRIAKKSCPEGYRIPTRDEFIELLGVCDSDVLDGKSGYCLSCEKSSKCSSMFGEDKNWYWCSNSTLYGVYFKDGDMHDYHKGNDNCVRCVRRVQ